MAKTLQRKTGTAVAALSIQIADRTGKEIQLLPAGRFSAVDGRPASIAACAVWVLDAENAQLLISAASARNNPAVIDYEHQTLMKEQNGQPAPAAGWFKHLIWREGVGLFATDVAWTPAAAQAIADGEYRFISPVIRFDPQSGRVTGLVMAALTNYAGIDGMQQASLTALSHAANDFFNDEQNEEPHMNALLAALLAALGLDGKATEAQALSALTAFISNAKDATDKVTSLSADLVTAGLVTANLMTASKNLPPDPARFVPIEAVQAMQTQLSRLSTQMHGGAVDKVVETALAAGKLLPAQEQWARDLGAKDIAVLNAFVATAPQIAALTGSQTGGKQVDVSGVIVALSTEELRAATLLGQTPERYAEGKKKYA